MPLLLRICHSWFRFTLSKAFSKSRKAMWVSKLNSLLFSIVCLMVNTLSMHDLPVLNPFCSSSNIASNIVLKRCVIILAYILYPHYLNDWYLCNSNIHHAYLFFFFFLLLLVPTLLGSIFLSNTYLLTQVSGLRGRVPRIWKASFIR
jgi:hypothetical protein